jgi:hypothetical protein
LFFLQKRGKIVEPLGPEPFVSIEPFEGIAHRLGFEPACDRAPGFRARDQSGIRKHVEMLHDRRQRHWERRLQRAHRQARFCGKPHHQRPPRRVGQRRKGAVESALTVNHMV